MSTLQDWQSSDDALSDLKQHAAQVCADARRIGYLLSEAFVADIDRLQRLLCVARKQQPNRVSEALREVSYSPTLGQFFGMFKLQPAPADRFRWC
jgi:hypothetical protein